MGWLWPESNVARARSSLGSAVHTLRKSLSSGEPQKVNTPDFIVFEDGQYSICKSIQISSDVQEFGDLCQRGCHFEETRRTREAITEYEKAIELYQGDYLVEDLHEEWTMVERERLVYLYVDALDRVARYQLEAGQLRKCIQICYRLLEKEPSHEESYCRLMQCYAHLGLRFRALEQYRLCQEILSNRFGITPSPETQTLCREIVPNRIASTAPASESGFIRPRLTLS